MMEDVNALNEASQTLHDSVGGSGHPLISCTGSRCESGLPHVLGHHQPGQHPGRVPAVP